MQNSFDVSEPAKVIAPENEHPPGLSPLHQKLLAEFARPNRADVVAKLPYWEEALGEPVKTVLGRFKAQGLLFEPNSARVRLCFRRDESDLRVLCLEHGLAPTGSAEQLADRLLAIDPTGWLLGYPGELLQCSEFAVQTMVPQQAAAVLTVASAPLPDPGAGEKASRGDGRPLSRLPPSPSGGRLSDNAVIWGMLKEHAQQTAREGNLALCRNVHLAMANHLLRRNHRTKALQALCVVCTFDLCGVRNRDDAPIEKRGTYSRFDAAHASLAPWLVSRVNALCRDMLLSKEEIRETFLRVVTRLKVPRDPPKLWAVLQTALAGDLATDDEIRRSRTIRDLLNGAPCATSSDSPKA